MQTLREILSEIAAKHDERMKTDASYAMTFYLVKDAAKPADRPRRYDRDGYCDNPARGY